jgi:pyrimidine deaminase RibD-like protein
MVAAAVVDPDNQIVARLNRPGKDGKRIHAEHAAMEDYTRKYGPIPEGSIIVTTLSPCNEHMDERDGPSCTSIINNSTVKKVYCGYMDPTQDDDTRQFNLMETADRALRNKCKQFADTFLDHVHENLQERRKKTKVRRAAYGPGPYGWYGYSNDSGGGDGGGGGAATGAGGSQRNGGSGGSGVVIIRWLDSFPAATATTGSPTYTNVDGYRIYQFTSSGTITI